MKKFNLLFGVMALFAIVTYSGIGFVSTIQAENAARSEPSFIEQTALFSIERMTCAVCPVTVSKAMESVGGVRDVAVDFETKTATVAFNPELTNIETIGAASTNAGYPAALMSKTPEGT